MNRVLNKSGKVREGMYTFENVKHFTSSKRKDMDIFALDKVFVPINYCNMHCYYATIDMKMRTIQIHNSSGVGSVQENQDLKHLWHYLQDEHKRQHNGDALPLLEQCILIENQPNTTPR